MLQYWKKTVIAIMILFFLHGYWFINNVNGMNSLQKSEDELFIKNHVATIHIDINESEWWQLVNSKDESVYVRADFSYDNELYENVAIRPKGFSSLMSAGYDGRLPLKIDFNYFDKDQNFRGIKKLNLNNGFMDPSFLRDILGYELFDKMELPTPRASLADIWVNDTHIGLYTIVEQIDKTFLQRNFKNPKGNLYKPEPGAGPLNWTKEDVSHELDQKQTDENNTNQNLVSGTFNMGGGFGARTRGMGMRMGMGFGTTGGVLEQMALKTNKKSADYTDLFNFLEVLNNSSDESFPSEIENVLDVNSFLRFLAVSTMIVHLDNYNGSVAHNYYLYEADGKFTVIPWDLNMAFGTLVTGYNGNVVDFPIDEPVPPGVINERPLVTRILAHQPYMEKYHQYLRQMLNKGFAEGVIEKRIDELVEIIRPYVEADTLKFFSDQDFEAGIEGKSADNNTPAATAGMGGFGMGGGGMMGGFNMRGGGRGGFGMISDIPSLKPFIKERRQSVIDQLEGKKTSRYENLQDTQNNGMFNMFGGGMGWPM